MAYLGASNALHTEIVCIKSRIPESRLILLRCDMHIIT